MDENAKFYVQLCSELLTFLRANTSVNMSWNEHIYVQLRVCIRSYTTGISTLYVHNTCDIITLICIHINTNIRAYTNISEYLPIRMQKIRTKIRATTAWMYLHVVVRIRVQISTDKFTDDAVTNISKGVDRDADGGNRHREPVSWLTMAHHLLQLTKLPLASLPHHNIMASQGCVWRPTVIQHQALWPLCGIADDCFVWQILDQALADWTSLWTAWTKLSESTAS